MLEKSQIIATDSLLEYGKVKGSYFLEAPIVDVEFVRNLDYSRLVIESNEAFRWVFDAVLKSFRFDIFENDDEEDDDTADENYEEDFENYEDEEYEYSEEDEDDEDDTYEEDEDELFINSATKILGPYISQLPNEIKKPLIYIMNNNEDIPYKIALCMDNLDNEQRFNIFKEWFSDELLYKLRDNIIYGEKEGFQTDTEDSLDDIKEYLDMEKDYELIFNMLISFMYAYRLVFALISHSSFMYNYIAERLFKIWELIEDIFMLLNKHNKEALSRMGDKIFDYLRFFNKNYGLSILDGKMYLTASILSNNTDDKIIEYLSEAPRNQIANRYLAAAYYVVLKKQSNEEAELVYEKMDDTSKIVLSDLYYSYKNYKQVIDILEDVRENTRNKAAYQQALDDLECLYENLDMYKELLDIYYAKLNKYDERAFENIVNYIYRVSVVNKDDLESILETAQKKLTDKYYFKCLMKCGFYDKCIDIIRTSKKHSLISYISDELISEMHCEYNSDNMKNFLKQAFEALSKNKIAVHSKKIRDYIEKYLQ